MSLMTGEKIGQNYGATEVLKSVTFRLSAGEKIGLVGPNGEGKTTLLRIMAGQLDSTYGQVSRRRHLSIGYLPQIPPALEGGHLLDAMQAVFADIDELETELAELAERMARGETQPEVLEEYGALQSRFETLGGYDRTVRIEQVLTGLGFERELWTRPLAKLSGGQRTRAYLATLLLRDPEVLMLDEPTNHLDLDSVEWLEDWLQSFAGALVVVSHDRYFLDHVTTATWELAFGGMEAYPGPYSKFLSLRSERYLERMRQWETQQEYIERTKEFVAKYLAGQRSREAQGRRTRLERFMRDEAIEKPRLHETIHLSLRPAPRSGDIVARARDLVIGYSATAPLVQAPELEVTRGQRIAIVGPNGIGKTTLLRTMLGQLPPLAGMVKLGASVLVGYLSQIHSELDPSATVVDSLQASCPGLKDEAARTLLGSLLLSGEDAFKRVEQLSGGQRSRLVLARLAAQEVNFLMLDEPTNHLDIPSTEAIQEVLQKFAGTIIFVSHDRYLVQAVATDIWAVDGGEVRHLRGGWEDYLRWRRERRERAAGLVSESAAVETQAREGRKAEYRETKRRTNQMQRLRNQHEEVEARIHQLEGDLVRLNAEISAAGEARDLAGVERLGRDYQEAEARLKDLWQEWEETGSQLE